MNVENLLEFRDQSLLIIEERDNKEAVIAVPHHAPLGVEELPCKEHKIADENAGLLGLYTAKNLECCLIIACNYFLDSNKNVTSDYFNKIMKWAPKLLIEIHGHGSRSARYDIEISSGNSKRNKWSIEMANRLEKKMGMDSNLQQYSISGDFNNIYFKASLTKTINSDNWTPFHIELPKSLRAEKKQYQPFCEFLSQSVIEILQNYDQISSL
jgi:hypothetical protein